jgi:hypothetical protein
VGARPAIVQQLDFEAVAGPVKLGRRLGDAQRQLSLVADGQLHKYVRESLIGQGAEWYIPGRPQAPDQTEAKQLQRQEREQNEYTGQRRLQDQRQACHGKRSGPPISDSRRHSGG